MDEETWSRSQWECIKWNENFHAGHLNLMPAVACLVNLSNSCRACRPSINGGMAFALA